MRTILDTTVNILSTALQQNAVISNNVSIQNEIKSHLQIWIHYSNNTIIYFVMAKDNKNLLAIFYWIFYFNYYIKL